MENSSYGKKQCSRQFWNAVERQPVKLESSILPRAKRASSETTQLQKNEAIFFFFLKFFFQKKIEKKKLSTFCLLGILSVDILSVRHYVCRHFVCRHYVPQPFREGLLNFTPTSGYPCQKMFKLPRIVMTSIINFHLTRFLFHPNFFTKQFFCLFY